MTGNSTDTPRKASVGGIDPPDAAPIDGQVQQYDSATDKMEWATVSGGSAVWGGITGTLSSQTDLQTALNGKAASSHSHSISDVTGLQTQIDSKQATLVSGTNIKTVNGSSLLGSGNLAVSAVVSLTSANGKASGNVTMSATNTWYTGASVSLTAGTWLIVATITLNRNTTTAQQYQARIYDGTTAYASTQEYQASVANAPISLAMNTVIILSGSATVSVQGASSTSTNNTILAATLANGQGNNATQISAIKIAEFSA